MLNIPNTIHLCGKIGSGKTSIATYLINLKMEIAMNSIINRLIEIRSNYKKKLNFEELNNMIIIKFFEFYKKELIKKQSRKQEELKKYFFPDYTKIINDFILRVKVVNNKIELKEAFDKFLIELYKIYYPDYIEYLEYEEDNIIKKRYIKYYDFQEFYNQVEFFKIDKIKYIDLFINYLNNNFDKKNFEKNDIIKYLDSGIKKVLEAFKNDNLQNIIDKYDLGIKKEIEKIENEIDVKINESNRMTGIIYDDILQEYKNNKFDYLEKYIDGDIDFYKLSLDYIKRNNDKHINVNKAVKDKTLIEYIYLYYVYFLRGNCIVSTTPIYDKRTETYSTILDCEWYQVAIKRGIVEPYIYIIHDEASMKFHSYETRGSIVKDGTLTLLQCERHFTDEEYQHIFITQTPTSLNKQIRDNLEAFIFLYKKVEKKIITFPIRVIYKLNDIIRCCVGKTFYNHNYKKKKIIGTYNDYIFKRKKNCYDSFSHVLLNIFCITQKFKIFLEKKFMTMNWFCKFSSSCEDSDLKKSKITAPLINIIGCYHSTFYQAYYYDVLNKNPERLLIANKYNSLDPSADELLNQKQTWLDDLFELPKIKK